MPLYVLHLADDDRTRSNLGFSELRGEPVTVTVQLRNGEDGQPVGGPRSWRLEPFSHLQARVRTVSPSDNLYAEIRVAEGTGRAVAYGSRVDNASQDAVFIPAARPPRAAAQMVPVVASDRGQGGTRWRSDLRLANLGPVPAELRLEFRPGAGGSGDLAIVELKVANGEVEAIHDVVEDLFGLSDTAGSLRVVDPGGGGRILVSSRTANWTDGGSYGQFVPAVTLGHTTSATVIGVDTTQDRRANLGLCEVSGEAVTVGVRMYDSLGRSLGRPSSVDLAPYQMYQINGVFDRLAATPGANARVTLVREDGEGAFVAYASVVDNHTGDAIYIPGQPMPAVD
jgi:hypothetical protein